MCPKRGFKAEELVGHRCPSCRAKRVMTVELDAQRAVTPWVPEGQQVWVRVNGLGEDFINELESAYQAIVEFPQTWPKFQKGFRRFLLCRFPF